MAAFLDALPAPGYDAIEHDIIHLKDGIMGECGGLDIRELLGGNPYPGRGIVMGLSRDGRRAVCAYFIMGRSINSRNRVLLAEEDDIVIKPYDAALVSDSSLIIYRPMRQYGHQLIVSNGDQTDSIYAALERGQSFEDSLRARRFEPDGPHFTPRISGLMDLSGGDFRLSILKAADNEGGRCLRCFYEYEARPGEARFIHTYAGDGSPLPPFGGEPLNVHMPDDTEAFSLGIWESLNSDNKVALVVRATALDTGETRRCLFNRHKA